MVKAEDGGRGDGCREGCRIGQDGQVMTTEIRNTEMVVGGSVSGEEEGQEKVQEGVLDWRNRRRHGKDKRRCLEMEKPNQKEPKTYQEDFTKC